MGLFVSTKDLLPGLFLSENICGESGQVLINKGIELTSTYIQKLKQLNINSVIVSPTSSKQKAVKLEEKEVKKYKFFVSKNSEKKISIPTDLEHNIRSQLKETFTKKTTPKAFVNMSNNIIRIAKSIFDNPNNFSIADNIKELKNFDNYTYEHSWNVFVITMGLLKKSVNAGLIDKIDNYYINSMGIGALLHDIGKMFIPTTILNKQGPLTDPEFLHMQQHVNIGFGKLKEAGFYTPITKAIALHHHRKWDGGGYGSKSENVMYGGGIPFQVRIVSIADAYDALVSDRIYRTGFTSGEALLRLEKDSGTHFDPEIISVVKNILPELKQGNIVLLRNGFIVNIDETAMFGETIKGSPICSIFGITENLFNMDNIDRKDIVARGNGIPHLKLSIEKNIKGKIPLRLDAPELIKPLLQKALFE